MVIAQTTLYVLGRHLNEVAIRSGNDVPGRKSLDVDDGKDAPVDVVLVHVARDQLLLDMMDEGSEGLVRNGCSAGEASAESCEISERDK